jgi:ABC-type phosphate transport system substrate-binding protein
MAQIQIGIEGEGAPAAAEALLEIPGISGTYEVPTQREGTLAAIATIITIVGGAATLAEQIRKWYQEWHKSHPGKQFDVVILDPETGNRILLEDATIEEITQILQSLNK